MGELMRTYFDMP
jgi:hypothetical protein